MRLIAAALACAAFSSFAGPVAVFKSDSLVIRAYVEDCDLPQVAAVLSRFGSAKKAAVVFEGREIRACYSMNGENVMVMDEEGDGGAVPAAMFREAKGA